MEETKLIHCPFCKAIPIRITENDYRIEHKPDCIMGWKAQMSRGEAITMLCGEAEIKMWNIRYAAGVPGDEEIKIYAEELYVFKSQQIAFCVGCRWIKEQTKITRPESDKLKQANEFIIEIAKLLKIDIDGIGYDGLQLSIEDFENAITAMPELTDEMIEKWAKSISVSLPIDPSECLVENDFELERLKLYINGRIEGAKWAREYFKNK